MTKKIIKCYAVFITAAGLYGLLSGSFIPTRDVKFFASVFSSILFVFAWFFAARWLMADNAKHAKLRAFHTEKPLLFICLHFPVLLFFAALLHQSAWSRGVPSIYTQLTAKAEVSTAMISNVSSSRRAGQRASVTGYRERVRVPRHYQDGQRVSTFTKRSRFGTHIGLSNAPPLPEP